MPGTPGVWGLMAMAILFCFCLLCVAHPEGEKRGERKRNRDVGRLSALRSGLNRGGNQPLPVDPLFTDQREIRLSFTKERPLTGSMEPPVKPTVASKTAAIKKPSRPDNGGDDERLRKAQVGPVKKPNIILMVTDDQDVELGSLDYMPKTRAILKDGGSFFPNSFVSTPMCCPSRSSMLTGLFVHNHGVLTNANNCSSPYWQAVHEPRTFGAYLAGAGYRTGYFGKYLNKYNGSYVPTGWREWAGLVMNSRYYNYTINVNGQKVKHGADYHLDYYPDLITNDSISFLRQSKQQFDDQPFLMVMSFPSPHGPEDSAPQYSNMFMNVTRHRTPSYDFAPNPDKQWILRWLGKMKPVHHRFTDMLMTKRLQTLQSVDDAVERVYKELATLGQLDNTYIFYTSDHGYHLGQFGLVKGKSFPFESDVRVPFLVRGPGVGRGRVVQSLIGNIDLAPTFLEIAGIPVPSHMDGASIVRFLQKEKVKSLNPWRDTYLIERGRMPPTYFPKLNVLEDVQNVSDVSAVASDDDEEDREGASLGFLPPVGKFERWAVECRKPQYQGPCTGFQKYECAYVDGRWRMKKCPPTSVQNVKKKWCKCNSLSQYRLGELEPEERRMQRAFIKEHTSVDWRGYRPRFLRTMTARALPYGARPKRQSAAEGDILASTVAVTATTETSVLVDVAEDELDQVELTMEDISEEISDLEALTEDAVTSNSTDAGVRISEIASSTTQPLVTTSSRKRSSNNGGGGKLNCLVLGKKQINCSSEVYSDMATWRLSRDYLEKQILVLRVHLDQLRIIRKHLRSMKPTGGNVPALGIGSSGNKIRKYKSPLFPTFDWQSPVVNTSDGVLENRLKTIDGGDEESDNGPAETIEVTIYDDRKIKSDAVERSGYCPCVDVSWSRTWLRNKERLVRRANRRRLKEERLKRRQRKLSRKQAMAKSFDGQCNYDKMNCFSHDNDHWRTAPRWTDGPFCVCMNANNNTYWCLRTFNATHNSLYCEFITGFVTYYDMRIDPYQLRNIAHTLTEAQLNAFHQTLEQMRVCKGADCFVNSNSSIVEPKQVTEVKNTTYHSRSKPSIDQTSRNKLKPRRSKYSGRSDAKRPSFSRPTRRDQQSA